MKKKVLLFLLASPALVAASFFASSPFSKAQEAAAATSYIDVASSLTSLSSGSFYLFGAYNEENGVPYVYLMSYRYTGTFVRVPCLSKTDASHPCGISESDFTSSCLYSIIRAQAFSTTVSDLTFGFIANVGALYADKTSHEFTGTTTTDGNVTPTLTFDTTASPNTLSLEGWEYQIANEIATFKGYTTTSPDSGYSTALLVYPVSTSLFQSTLAVGFASGLASSAFTAETAQATYQGMSREQRLLFYYYRNTYRTSAISTQAIEKILIDGVSSYSTLMKTLYPNESDITVIIYKSKAPVATLDYTTDCFTGLDDNEAYKMVVDTSTTVTDVYPQGGKIHFAGMENQTIYDCSGKTISLLVYGGSGNSYVDSDSLSLTVEAHLAAPSVTLTNVSLPISPDSQDNVNGYYSDRLTFAPEDNVEFLILSSSETFSFSELNSYTWVSNPDFTGLSPETSYTIYKRYHSTTANDSLPKYDETTSGYLGTSVTTLSEVEGLKKTILLAAYTSYQSEVAKLSGASADNLLAMLTTLRNKVEAATSVSDLSAYQDGTYASSALAYAQQKDSAIASLSTTAALATGDSDESRALIAASIAAINALDYFQKDDIAKANALAQEAEWKITAYRYRESAGKSLVDFFNDSIIPKTSLLSESQVESLWTSFATLFHTVMTTLSSDLATSKTAVDSAFDTAKTSLTSQLEGMGA